MTKLYQKYLKRDREGGGGQLSSKVKDPPGSCLAGDKF